MTKIQIYFNDLLKMLAECEHPYHFEAKDDDEFNQL